MCPINPRMTLRIIFRNKEVSKKHRKEEKIGMRHTYQ